MFKIGDFSKLSQVSIKTLRYYDEIGLLKPGQVDRFTGYRLYSASQLTRLNQILAFKDLGFSLEQIAQLLNENLPPSQIRGMLRLRQLELQHEIATTQERLLRIASRLSAIEQEYSMSTYEVVIKSIEPQTVIAIRRRIPNYSAIGDLLNELFGFMGQHQIKPNGAPLSIYYDPEYREQDVDAEALVPVSAGVIGDGPVVTYELPSAATMACVIYQGGYSAIGQAYSALMHWIEANGYRIVGPNREIYLRGPESGPDESQYVTEVQFPIEKA